MTNFDKVKKMNADKLAELISGEPCKCCVYDGFPNGCGECKEGVRRWLTGEPLILYVDGGDK